MRKFLKIIFIASLLILVLFSVVADMRLGPTLQGWMPLAMYLRVASLLGLAIAVGLAWGYKHKIDASQKYQRADAVLAEAVAAAERKQNTCAKMEEELKAAYAIKEQALNDQFAQAKAEYQERIRVLKEQNLQLKEAVGKLMHMAKQKQPC